MKQDDIDWRGGEVTYWSLDRLGQEKPSEDNRWMLLDEDQAQIQYGDSHVLDVGWYPSSSLSGAFRVRVIRDRDWEQPLFDCRAISADGLSGALGKAIEFVSRRLSAPPG